MSAGRDLADRRGEENDGLRGRLAGDGGAGSARSEQDRRGEERGEARQRPPLREARVRAPEGVAGAADAVSAAGPPAPIDQT